MAEKVKTTQSVRMCIDLELRHPRDVFGLKALAQVIEDTVNPLRSVASAKVTQTIPAESNFDWQGQ